MRLKLVLTSVFAVISGAAMAHPEHGFTMPDVLHVVTQADHLAIAAGVVIILAIIGGLMFKQSRK